MPAQTCLKLFPRSRIFRGNSQSSKWRDFWKMFAAGDLWCGGQLSHMCSLLGEFKLLEQVFFFNLFLGFFGSVLHLTCVIWSVVWEIEKRHDAWKVEIILLSLIVIIVTGILITIVLNSGEAKISIVHAHHPQPICRWDLHKLISRRN